MACGVVPFQGVTLLGAGMPLRDDWTGWTGPAIRIVPVDGWGMPAGCVVPPGYCDWNWLVPTYPHPCGGTAQPAISSGSQPTGRTWPM